MSERGQESGLHLLREVYVWRGLKKRGERKGETKGANKEEIVASLKARASYLSGCKGEGEPSLFQERESNSIHLAAWLAVV